MRAVAPKATTTGPVLVNTPGVTFRENSAVAPETVGGGDTVGVPEVTEKDTVPVAPSTVVDGGDATKAIVAVAPAISPCPELALRLIPPGEDRIDGLIAKELAQKFTDELRAMYAPGGTSEKKRSSR